jgi:hypothetical protein
MVEDADEARPRCISLDNRHTGPSAIGQLESLPDNVMVHLQSKLPFIANAQDRKRGILGRASDWRRIYRHCLANSFEKWTQHSLHPHAELAVLFLTWRLACFFAH